jgi:hypothetical protein
MITIDELIHTQTSKIGLIAAEIAKTLSSPELTTQENVTMLTQKLETWRQEVPLMLQIPTLTSSNPPNVNTYQRRAILMVHVRRYHYIILCMLTCCQMMYLGALILLYRQLLVATAETRLTDGFAWSTNIPEHEARRYRDECAIAAQQMARILDLIAFDGILVKRCWLIM